MKKIPVEPWSSLSESYKVALIEDLLEDWPDMSSEDREHVMFHDPDKVKAAGLWPGVEGDAALLKIIREDPTGELTRERSAEDRAK